MNLPAAFRAKIDPAVLAKIEAAARKRDLPQWRCDQIFDALITPHLMAMIAELEAKEAAEQVGQHS